MFHRRKPTSSQDPVSHSVSIYLLLNLLRWHGFTCSHGASNCLYSTTAIFCCFIDFKESISDYKFRRLNINTTRIWHKYDMGRAKRICVFEHSVMTNFNCACPAIQRGQGFGFLSEGSSWLTACMSEQRRFWRDCADAQARLNLRCSHRR